MCGVIGVIYDRQRADLGRIAAELLRTLEYRGYDSTGAAIQGPGHEVILRKGVGAPSAMVQALGIVSLPGQIMCGQVRWATFGAVTEANAQPHVVACKPAARADESPNIYGAHNGNVTNSDQLKTWLGDEGHKVLSDNDGEMVVHTVEHCFARALDDEIGPAPDPRRADHALRRAAMRSAIVSAAARLEGSYAAVIVDPISRCLWAIKQGSSLYFGFGADEVGGPFAIASSDLSSVLKLTRALLPLREGEFVEYEAGAHRLYALLDHHVSTVEGPRPVAAGEVIARAPVRSRLRAHDTALSPPFQTFMEQEIAAQQEVCGGVITLFEGGAPSGRGLRAVIDAHDAAAVREIATRLETLRDEYDDARLRTGFATLADSHELRALVERLPREVADAAAAERPDGLGAQLISSEAGFFTDLLPMARGRADVLAVRLLDALVEREEVRGFLAQVETFLSWATEALARGGRLIVVCCGSSYNAARAAALFFNEMSRTDLVPLLPGEFRERVSHSLRDGDLVIAISQSGETKDLVDVMNDTIASGRAIRRVAVVNNVNSTLAEEKSDLVIPLRCGPEVAVPATKSFMVQMAVFYGLALRLGERRAGELRPGSVRDAWQADLARRAQRFRDLPSLLGATLDATAAGVEEAAQLLYLKSSIHLLAIRLTALAREGALKIREVVLNHAEGFEGSEFKHGPNTILGYNTIAGPREIDALLRRFSRLVDTLVVAAAPLGEGSAHRLIQAASDAVFGSGAPLSLDREERAVFDKHFDHADLIGQLRADYPLVYLTGPDERDVNLTISQINTHKIRGSSTIVIAEENPALASAATRPPVDNPAYRSVIITLPRTGDALMTVFSATVALQRLALRMSLLKMQYLDRLGIKDHGVHPDVPKNVSKSITVD